MILLTLAFLRCLLRGSNALTTTLLSTLLLCGRSGVVEVLLEDAIVFAAFTFGDGATCDVAATLGSNVPF